MDKEKLNTYAKSLDIERAKKEPQFDYTESRSRNPKIKDEAKAEKLAYKNERQGQVLANHVLELLEDGKTEAKAIVGRFPLRSPSNMDRESVTLAANAALRESDTDAKIDVYDAETDEYGGVKNTVVVTHIDGEPIPTSDLYRSNKAAAAKLRRYGL